MGENAKHSSTSPARTISDGPFCWQRKAALRKIRESFDAEKAVASAIGAYVALSEIASDEQSETFVTTHAYIALKSGLSPRTIASRLSELAEIGLVEISTPVMKAPSTYRLLPVTQPLQNDKQPLPNVLQRTKKASLQASEQSVEESKEQSVEKEGIALRSSLFKSEEIPFEVPTDEEFYHYLNVLEDAGTSVDVEFAESFFQQHEKSGWKIRGRRIRYWRRALVKFCGKCENDRSG
jgi:hypothetical protein